MVRTGVVLLACVAWLGCAPGETFQEGTRLRFQWLVAEDGVRAFSGYFDTELATPCAPSRMADGVVRCVPVDQSGVALGSLLGPSTERFADDQCTQPLLAWSESSCSRRPRFVTRSEGEGCARAAEVYEVGEVVPAAETFRREGGACQQDPGTPFLPEQRRLTAFAGQRLIEFSENEVALGAIKGVQGRSRDGAAVLLQLRDGASGLPCRPTSLDALVDLNGPAACLPPSVNLIGNWWLFTGPSCSAPAFQPFFWDQCDGSTPTPPKVARRFPENESCELTSSEFFELGDRVEAPHRQGMACEPFPTTGAVYEVGEKIDPRRFPAVEVAVSGTKLETSTMKAANRALALPTYFWLDGRPCTVTDFADGAKRCLPRALTGGDLFVDAACTRPVFSDLLFSCRPPELLVEVDKSGCTSRATRVFRPGSRATSSTARFSRPPGSADCLPTFVSSADGWEPGEEVPATLFPTVTPLGP